MLRFTTGSTNSTIRAKVCQCVGNMFRFSDYFAAHWFRTTNKHSRRNCIGAHLFESLTAACDDENPQVRKMACFAIGNAAFHSARLYEELSDSIPYLTKNLADNDDKTRANAAGAVGNLARNGDGLIPELIRRGAITALVSNVMCERSPTTLRISVLSLATCFHHDLCYKESIPLVEFEEWLSLHQSEVLRMGGDTHYFKQILGKLRLGIER